MQRFSLMQMAFGWLALGAVALATSGCPSNDRGAETPGGTSSGSAALSPKSPTKAAALPPVPAMAPVPTDCAHRGSGRDLTVGPGKKYASLGEVPFESLKGGDTVRLFWRDKPYHEKLMIGGKGTAEQPIRLCGVPGPKGQLPVIDGKGATTRPGLEFQYDGHQVRGLVTIGHRRSEPWRSQPQHFVVEGLEVRNATEGLPFTDRAGKPSKYSRNAAGIYVQRADYVTIRGCVVHDNQNGLFIGGGGVEELTRHVRIIGNHIYNNGSTTDYYEHNVYNEAIDVLYEYNWMQSPRAGKQGVQGSNIKERSAGVVIRYNWIEDGAHVLDIVDAQEARFKTRDMPSFHVTYVYGNVIIRGPKPSGSMFHYGGDSEVFEFYRKGTLYFFNNTVAVYNDDYPLYARTEVFELSTNEENLVSFNNLYWSSKKPKPEYEIQLLGSRDGLTAGLASFAADWIAEGWEPADARRNIKVTAKIKGLDAATRGTDPGFRNAAAKDFNLTPSSPQRDAGQAPPAKLPSAHRITHKYVPHQQSKARADNGKTLGAFD